MKNNLGTFSLALLAAVISTSSSHTLAADDYFPPVSFQKMNSTYTVQKDGSFQEEREIAIRIETEEGASSYGERKISYTPKLESLRILRAYTILPDGRHINVPQKNIRSAKGNIDSDQATYSDTQYKVVIYPKVVQGSQQYLRYVKTRHTPLFAGQFLVRNTFSPHFKFAQGEINIIYDKRINISFDSNGVDGGQIADVKGMHHYRFTFKQDTILPAIPGQIDIGDYASYVQATTFKSYEELGAAYQEKAKSKVIVTPAIQQLANDLTVGIIDQREQTHKLYNWVSKNIRYVGSYIGNGGYVPHNSQTILDNRWGDCKDHVVILEALLMAKGIDSSPALINAGSSYVLPKLAELVFSHVITYVPSLDLYLDSTAQFAPFGTLPLSDLGKSAVLTGLNRVGKTPPMLALKNEAKTSIRLKILTDGRIQGTSLSQGSGGEDIYLRNLEFMSKSLTQDERSRILLSDYNLTGIGQFSSSDPNNLDIPIELKTTFTLDPMSNLPGPAAMTIPAGLAYNVLQGKLITKPLDKYTFPVGCNSFVTSNLFEIEFPSSIKITHVPDNVSYKDDVVQYSATYTLIGHTLSINRELISQNKSMVCGEMENELEKAFFPIYQRDMRSQVIYE